MTVSELVQKLSLVPVSLPCTEKEIDGVYIGDLLSWVMGRAESQNIWITIMSNINIVAVASLADVSCVILAEGVTLADDVRATAESKGVNILSSDKTAFEISIEIAELQK